MLKASKRGSRLLASLVFIAINGQAAQVHAQDRGWYIGAGAGQSKANDVGSCSDLNGLFDPGFSCSINSTDTGWKLFGGYQFNRNLAVEGSYVDLGNFKMSASGTAGGIPSTASGSDKATGFSVDAVGTWPINEQFGLTGRVGLFAWTLDTSTSASGGLVAIGGESPTGTSLDFGVGAKYDFGQNVGVRAEFQRFQSVGNDNTGKSDIDLVSASLVYRFR